MAYHTQANIEDAVGGAAALNWIADPLNSSPALAATATLIASAIAYADAQIDAAGAGTPGTGSTAGALWTDAGALIIAKHVGISISLYIIYERVRREETPQSVKDAYTEARERLAALRKGEESWVMSEPPAVQNTGTVWAFTPESTARDANPRRTLRSSLDLL
jgi:hypothetical protein